jgi:nucleoid-associated protein YejK
MHICQCVVIEAPKVNKRIYAYVSCMNCIKHINRVSYDFNPNSKIGYIKWILGQVEKRVTSFVCVFLDPRHLCLISQH